MSEFLAAVGSYPFMRYALAAGLLASVACGIVGSYVVARRITYIAGSIAHCVLGGIGAARYMQVVHHWEAVTPFMGAVIAALISAIIIGYVSLKAKQREDTVIGALWAIGMAVGVMFISRTPGYNEDLMSYLFGNILMVSSRDLWVMAGFDVLVGGIALVFYNELLAVCFDEEFARVRGIPVELYYLLLLCLTAVTVVLLATVVGVLMVIALLTLPVAVANIFAKTMGKIMVLAVVISALFTTTGLAVSYGPDFPAGASIIVVAGAVYIGAVAAKGLAGLVRK
ncbi:MAG: metal ABC transporter permease [Pseudomonadota bacterium]